jgi:hypothetical protein
MPFAGRPVNRRFGFGWLDGSGSVTGRLIIGRWMRLARAGLAGWPGRRHAGTGRDRPRAVCRGRFSPMSLMRSSSASALASPAASELLIFKPILIRSF